MTYQITCTSTCDLTKEILEKKNIKYACFKFIIDGKEYLDDFYSDYNYHKFYDDISKGVEPTTSQVGYGAYAELFEPILKEGKDVLHICLSSGISGDYQTAKMVADELNDNYPNKVYVVDSLGASSGYGMLVNIANDNLEKGMSVLDNYNYLEENKLRIHHWFISTDLSSYVRGGRISKAAGLVGGALKICPLMNMPQDGTLNPVEKIRTKSKAMQGQLNKMIEFAENGLDYNNYCYISCSDCEEDADVLINMIKDTFKNVKDVELFRVGTTIGSHTGQGTIALYFISKDLR